MQYFKMLSFALVVSVSVLQNTYAQQLFVAPNGNDKNSGTIDKPFATLAKAKEAIRELKKNKGLDKDGVTVFLRGGNYQLTNSFELTKEDGGEVSKPVVYKAYQNEVPHIIGGTVVEAKYWKPLDKEAIKRVHPSINPSKLVALDVSELRLKNVGQFAPHNQFVTDWFIIDLFANDKRQPIAQFPNPTQNIRGKNDPGWITCNGTKDNMSFYYGANGNPDDADTTNELDIDGTHRTERWSNALKSGHEIWLKGLWRVPWDPITMKVQEIDTKDQSIRFYEQPPSGMGSKYTAVVSEKPLWRKGSGNENYFAINLLEEIDQPGEWALDIKDKRLYYYPAAPIDKLNIMISDMTMPIVKLNGVDNLQIVGLQVEGGLGTAIDIANSTNVTIAACNIINAGKVGISMNGGNNNTILSNNISETAGVGIDLKNLGDRKTLTSSNVLVQNNYIHHVGKLIYKQGIFLTNCVGVTVSHNLIHDIPTGSVRTLDVNNCIFEYNEIHNIALKEGDTGAFYSYGGWSTYGNVFRYNFMHHINRANGLYSDDGDSGDFYYKNIIQDCVNGVLFGGGHDVLAENNLFIQSKSQIIDDRGKDRNYRLGTKYETNLTQFNINKSPWKEYGENLKTQYQLSTNLWGDVLNPNWHAELPNGSRMNNNVAVASGKFQIKTGKVEAVDNITIKTIDEATFYNYANMDLRTKNPIILQKIPELNEFFPTIGLQKDSYRKTIPTRKETGGLSNRTVAIDTEDKMVDQVKPTK
jgi:hypothetical protein